MKNKEGIGNNQNPIQEKLQQIKYELENKFDSFKFSTPRDQWDFENEIGQCCCSWCMPSDESPDEGEYPYRFCGSGKIVHGPQDRFPEVF